MKLVIQSLHFNSKPELNNFVSEKVYKLSQFHSRIESANVCLKLEKSDSNEDKICEIRLAIPGNDLFVKRQSATFEEAAKNAIDALQNQIRKLKIVSYSNE